VLVTPLLVSVPAPASAADGDRPPAGASRLQPVQTGASAAGRGHEVAATATKAEGSTPSSEPVLPPAAKGVVGPERRMPDPPKPPPQCQPCPPGTTPRPAKPGAVTGGQPAEMLVGPTPKGFVAGASRELTDRRTSTSTVFANPDGTKTVRVHSAPTFARDASGHMVPIDTALGRAADGRYRPAAAAQVSFAPSSDDATVASYSPAEGLEVGFGVGDAATVDARAAGSEVRYDDLRPDADLVLEATGDGLREKIVLKSIDAPTTWRFPLRLRGLEPEYVESAGRIDLRDAAGDVRAGIPPGFMYDATPDPKTGTGVRSNGVRYSLTRSGGSWTLEVSLDEVWLRSPERRFPVIVDPPIALRDTAYGDTFVSSNYLANRDNGNETFMRVGTPNGGGEKAAAYVVFRDAPWLFGYILDAKISVYQTWAKSCTPSTLSVYSVTQSWFENDAMSWPGPAYNTAPVGARAFSRGGGCTSTPPGWEAINIDRERFTNWSNLVEPWVGFTLRASNTDTNAEKILASSENSGGAPVLDLLWADEGATYSLPSNRFSPPVTPQTAGRLEVAAQNWGSVWSANYALQATVRNLSNNAVVQTVAFPVGGTVANGVVVIFTASIGPVPAGSYRVFFTMRTSAGQPFDTFYGIPAAFVDFQVLPAATPEVASIYPPNNAQVDTLRPSLWGQYFDADLAPGGPFYWFRACSGTTDTPAECVDSQWVTASSFTVPAGLLSWGKTSIWYVAVYDGQNMSFLTGPYYLTTVVAQPEITHHLAGAPDDADVAGLNVQVGNYSAEEVDASVAVAGPPLEIRRWYNSQDLRSTGAFGSGWSTPLDQRVTVDPDGSQNVVVTLKTGRQVRFGRNADGTYAPPPGYNMTLVRGTGIWTLLDSSGERRVFNDSGRLTTVVDAYGRQQRYTYTSNQVTQIQDVASGRSLFLTWTSGRVTAVKSDAPVTGGTQPTWTYTYSGTQLTRACSPLSAQSCEDYQSVSSSHYRSVVSDDNPVAYYPLSEASGGTAVNVVARTQGDRNATYVGATLGQAGALAGTTDKAVSLPGTGTAAIVLPDNLATSTMAFAVELWFIAASGKSGVLFAEQNSALSATPTHWSPGLYIGTDFKLHAKAWTPTGGTQIVSAARVDNNAWHHVVLSVNVDRQDVYLDGVAIGSITGHPITHLDMSKAFIGNGFTRSWPLGVSGNLPFAGRIDDVAVYRHPLGPVQVSTHYAARLATSRLIKMTEPGAFIAMETTYDAGSGRVSTMKDRNGAVWNVSQPALTSTIRTVTVSSTGRDPVTYGFDANRAGRLVSRRTGVGTETWEYDAGGFVTKYIDANGREKRIYRDARGNITWESVFRAGAWVWENYGYYLNTADKLDPRNDRMTFQSGSRNAWDNDYRNRIRYTLDTTGRVTRIQYPGVAGAPTFPIEDFTYTDGTEAAVGGGTVPAGLIKRSTSRVGSATVHEYNSRGDLVRSTDPLGLVTTYEYDLLGRNTRRTTSAGAVTYGSWLIAYNAASLVSTETAPGVANPVSGVTHTAVTTYTYDASARVTRKEITDSTGGDQPRIWTTAYDPAGRPTRTEEPSGAVTVRTWNTAGDLARITTPTQLTMEYRYDDRRNLTETKAIGAGVDPNNAAATELVLESRAYDPAGQLASVVDAMGRETAYTYHNDGLRETEKRVRRDAGGTITSSTLLAQYEYDSGGNLLRLTSAGGVIRDYDYDDGGNLNRATLDSGGLARTTIQTFLADNSVTSRRQTNGLTFTTARSNETAHLFSAGGSLVNDGGARYADGTATFTYRFTFPADATTGLLNLELDNQFLVQFSPDNATWTERLRETNDVRDGSNRKQWQISLDSFLATSKTLYVRLGDSQPANGWGARLTRVALEYARAGQKAARTTNTFDAAGNVLTTTVDNSGGQPGAITTSMVRGARGLPVQTVDPTGATTSYSYDAVGQVTTVGAPARTIWRDGTRTDDFTPVTTIGRNVFGDATEERDAHGAVVRTSWEATRPRQITLPPYTPPGGTTLNPVRKMWFTAFGQPLREEDGLGRATVYGYDVYGRMTSKRLPDPDGGGPATTPEWTYKYDRLGELVETTDPTGARTSATYNDLGHPVTQTVAERVDATTYYYTTDLGRDDAGRLTSLMTPLDHESTFSYNAAGEQTLATDPAGLTLETRYDAQGRPTAEIAAGVRAISHTYDAAGRRVSESSHTVTSGTLSAPLRTSTVSYDAAGRPVVTTSAAGRITQQSYDAGGNLAAVTQRRVSTDPATAITVQLGYDGAGRRTRMTDGNGNSTDYSYNAWGSLTGITEPAVGSQERTWTTVYDAAAQAVTELLPGGVTRSRAYDGLGRLVGESGTGGGATTIARGFAYDAAGRTTNMTSPAGNYQYQYNDRGLLTRSTGPGGTSTFGYDGEDNLVSRTDASGAGTFTYDVAGRLRTAADGLAGTSATFTYNPTGDVSTITYGSGRPSQTLTYDNLGRLESDVVAGGGGAQVLSTSYGYDLDDLITRKTTTGYTGGGTNIYGYDGVGRLTGWTRPDGQPVTYGYDGASNRTTVTGPSGTRTYTYDARNRLTGASGGGEPAATNTWSDRGTLQTATVGTATTTYTNDAFDMPVGVAGPGYTASYTYDALGRLAQRDQTALVYPDLTNNAARVPAATGDAVLFRAPDGTPMSDRHGTGAVQLVLADRLHGDRTGAVNPTSGAVVASRSYDPYGTVTATSGQFSGGFQDGWTDPSTGLVNAHARWYDPARGAFTSRDSWTLPPDGVAAVNRYAYGNGNPVVNSDPTGHCGPCVIPIGYWIGGLIVVGIAALVVTETVDMSPMTSAAQQMLDRVMELNIEGMTALVVGLYQVGLTAEQILEQVRRAFADNSAVISITGPPAVTVPVTVPGATPVTAPVIPPPPPITQTLPNVIAPPVSLLPVGELLQNTIPATAALAFPQIMNANADGSEAANTAAVTAAAEAVRELSDAYDPNNCDPDDTKKLAEAIRELVEELAGEVVSGGLDAVDALLTPGQKGALDNPDNADKKSMLENFFRGNRVHIKVRDRLRELFPGEFEFRNGGKNNGGPDYLHLKSKLETELTTPGEAAAHRRRYGDRCSYAFYDMPTS